MQVFAHSHAILEHLDRANLFIVPLDNERRWYRYHHLFGDLLRQRLGQNLTPGEIAEYHIRASQWYEDNGLAIEAFHHATAANDVARAERLMEGKGIPLHARGAVNAILAWLASLPRSVLDARPLLWVRSATMALTAGQTTGVEEKLQAAEEALAAGPTDAELDPQARDLIGQIACARATLAVTRYQPEATVTQARRALEYLPPENLRFRFTANWALSVAYLFQGDRAAASRAVSEALSISQASESMFSMILAIIHLGRLQELANQLHQAAETYRRVLQMAGDQPGPSANDAYLGLARIYYEWNDLDAAQQYAQQSLQLARLYDRVLDRFIISEVFLARLKLAQGDADGAAAMLAQTEQAARQQNFTLRLPEIAATQVLVLLRQGSLSAAAQLAQQYELPLSQARVLMAQSDPSAAWAVLRQYRQQMEARGWQDERLRGWSWRRSRWTRTANRTGRRNCWARRWRWPSRAASSACLWMKGGRWRSYCPRRLPSGSDRSYVSRLLAAFGDLTKDDGPTTKLASTATRSSPPSLVEPLSATRAGNPEADRPGALEPGDRRAAVPGPGHRQRAQPPDLRQTPGAKPHRSHRPRPRAGLAVNVSPDHPNTQNNTSPNTKVSIQRHRGACIVPVS